MFTKYKEHHYAIWRTKIEDNDECSEYFISAWKSEIAMEEYIEYLNKRNDGYKYHYKYE